MASSAPLVQSRAIRCPELCDAVEGVEAATSEPAGVKRTPLSEAEATNLWVHALAASSESWAAVPTKNRGKKLDPGDDLGCANGQPNADQGGDIRIRRPMPVDIARHHHEENQGLQQEPH